MYVYIYVVQFGTTVLPGNGYALKPFLLIYKKKYNSGPIHYFLLWSPRLFVYLISTYLLFIKMFEAKKPQ